jgi:hypothetical protein
LATYADDGAPECTNGAASDDRGKLVTVPAVRIDEAIGLLDAGDVAGARAVLAGLSAEER